MDPTHPSPTETRSADRSSGDDGRVVAALEEYLSLCREGRRPDRAEFLARDPEIAGALADCLDGLEFVQDVASDLSSPGQARGGAPAGDRLGDFQIVREVGRGGMGIVYEAVQLSLGRRVALKVLPFAAALDPRQRQRFQIEAQAAAQLHHPRIVPVFAVGCERGVHYYAMQFIEGRSLADAVRELRRGVAKADGLAIADFAPPDFTPSHGPAPEARDEGPSPASTVPAPPTTATSPSQRGREFFRSVARLGGQAAEALDHAHGLGVLHRDVKPANLMVDTLGDLWVTDFGLARVVGDGSLTITGDLVGTLRYMSPEQVCGGLAGVDHRTDVYSLGATLYEALTLRPAFDGRDRQELLNQIAQDEPVPPRRIDPAIPRDLETIVLKAMAKEATGRYASAKDLADDLGRFLDDKPIRARRPSAMEHVAKWARRHRPIVATAATVLLLALAVGGALLGWQNRRLQEALAATEEARTREREAYAGTFDAMDAWTFPLMGEAATGGLLQGRKGQQAYDRAIAYYDRVSRSFRADPSPGLRTLAAKADRRAGFFRMILQDPRAKDDYRRAIAAYEVLSAEAGAPIAPRAELAETLRELGGWLWDLGKPAEGEPYLRRSIEIERALAAELPEVPDPLLSLINSRIRFAWRLEGAGRKEEAAQIVGEIPGILARAVADAPESPDLRRGLADGLQDLGRRMESMGQRREAVAMYDAALGLAPDDVNLLNTVAWSLVSPADAPPADVSRAVEMAKRVVEAQPEIWPYWNTLGVAHYRAGDWAAADEAIAKSAQLEGGDVPHNWFALAMIRQRQGNEPEARRLYERALSGMKGRSEEDPELLQFRAEAAGLLGLEPAPGDPARDR